MPSQAGQDDFVIEVLKGKRNGTFLDIGCGHPVYSNNTAKLARDYGWTGISVDYDHELPPVWQSHGREMRCENAIELNWEMFLWQFPQIDYLSMDVDEAQMALVVKFPWDKIRFSVMTIEHDAYRFGDKIRDSIREIIGANGYEIMKADVAPTGKPFEDWWVAKTLLPIK